MAVELRCPGTAPYGHGLTERFVHSGACCDQFTALPANEQHRTGLRIAMTESGTPINPPREIR